MKVEHGPQDPEEKKNYSLYWFLFSLILLIGFVWSLVDESFLRRPWKGYQADFKKLEIKKLSEERDGLAKSISEENADKIKALDAAAAEASRKRKSAEYAELKKKTAKAEKVYKEKDQDRAFTKADLDEGYYLYDHAKMMEGSSKHVEEMHAHNAKLETQLTEYTKIASQAEHDFQALQKDLKAMEAEIDRPETEKAMMFAAVDDLNRKIASADERVIDVQQIVSEGLWKFGRVDRCTSCHMGINKAGFEDAPQPFTTHPRREELFKNHPPEKFGCTACHHGQGAALSSAFKAHAYEVKKHGETEEVHYMHHWEEPMYRGKFKEASCNDCHGNRYNLPNSNTWAYANRMFVQLGCHGCHLVDGYDKLDKVGPNLNRLSSKVNPEWLVNWVQNPTEYNPHTRMPNFRLSREESVAIAAFLLDNADKEYHLREGYPGAGAAEAGRALVQSLGCQGCHVFNEEGRQKVDEFRAPFQPVRDHGPQLERIAEKVNAPWVFNWLKNPKDYDPHTRMPSLRLSNDEARNITSYLMTLSKPASADAALRQQLADPAVIKQGRELINKRGCYGCHTIKGFESAERIGPELTTFAQKTPNEMFFGDTLNKDAKVKVEDTWEDWTRNKLKDPVVYDTDRVKHLMPTFTWRDPDEIETMLVFLRAQDKVKAKAPWFQEPDARIQALSRGSYLVDFYNCNACHIIDGKNGTIRAYIPTDSLAPPNLASVGYKLQPDWMFKFLQNPTPVRTWLKVRMPSFNLSDEDFTALMRYFQAQSGHDVPYLSDPHINATPQSLQEGKVAFNNFGCTSCHTMGSVSASLGEARLASMAPNLQLAHARLNPDWMLEWLAEPAALVPGTRMPAFWEAATHNAATELDTVKKEFAQAHDEAVQATLQTDIEKKQKDIESARREIRKVRDYVLNLR